LPYPFTGKFYPNNKDPNAPKLTYNAGKDIELTLPDDLKASDIKWLSVWCRYAGANFGDVYFPDNLNGNL